MKKHIKIMEIEEDYVSFEVAKLLNEKGFEQYKCQHSYDSKGVFQWSDNLDPYECSAPTLQMAMKWLRKVHNLSVEVYRTACGYVGCIVSIPSGTDIKFLKKDGDDLPSGQYTTWEKACEATLKYSLENLI